MKKLLLIILLAMSASVSVVSCTEEVVTPTDGTSTDPTVPTPPGGKL